MKTQISHQSFGFKLSDFSLPLPYHVSWTLSTNSHISLCPNTQYICQSPSLNNSWQQMEVQDQLHNQYHLEKAMPGLLNIEIPHVICSFTSHLHGSIFWNYIAYLCLSYLWHLISFVLPFHVDELSSLTPFHVVPTLASFTFLYVSAVLDCEIFLCTLILPGISSDLCGKDLPDTRESHLHFYFPLFLFSFFFFKLFPLLFFHFIQGFPSLKIHSNEPCY